MKELSAAIAWGLGLGLAGGLAAAEYRPRATLPEELRELAPIRLADGYAGQRPRLLFGESDRAALVAKRAAVPPRVWELLIRQADGLRNVPSVEEIREGRRYYRAEWMLSGALSFWLTGNRAHFDNAVEWMRVHARADLWQPGEDNADLGAGWNLYYLALCYDLLHAQLAESDRALVRQALIDHARPVYAKFSKPWDRGLRYDQNHTYIPVTGLGAAALALQGESDEAAEWLRLSVAILRRCAYVQGDDGYYYEGAGYAAYALHWLVRWSDLVSRATGEPAHDLPLFRRNHLMLQHLSLPGAPYTWDIGDSGGHWVGARPAAPAPNQSWNSYLYRLAAVFHDREIRAVADRLFSGGGDFNDPAMFYLWHDGTAAEPAAAPRPPYHHFPDHGMVCWRSGWGGDDTVLMFKCGPPEGHAAAAKAGELTDWYMNHGHVHPDIGMFWLYARGQYLAVDTGYTQRKRTRDHNTILVNGAGIGNDYNYWSYRDLPYDMFDACRIEKIRLGPDYGYAMGSFGSAYPAEKVGRLSLRRHVLATRDFLLVFDEMSSDRPNAYTWLLHADGPFADRGDRFEADLGDARLAVYVLAPAQARPTIGPTVVFRGRRPHEGQDESVGHQLSLDTPDPVASNRFLTLLVPLGRDEVAPQATLSALDADRIVVELARPSGETVVISLDLAWKQPAEPGPGGPATIGKK